MADIHLMVMAHGTLEMVLEVPLAETAVEAVAVMTVAAVEMMGSPMTVALIRTNSRPKGFIQSQIQIYS